MIVILLGILDILAGLSIFTMNLSWGSTCISLSILYLIVKSLPFLRSFASIMDLFVAVVFFFALIGYSNTLINVLCALWLIQKGIISFF